MPPIPPPQTRPRRDRKPQAPFLSPDAARDTPPPRSVYRPFSSPPGKRRVEGHQPRPAPGPRRVVTSQDGRSLLPAFSTVFLSASGQSWFPDSPRTPLPCGVRTGRLTGFVSEGKERGGRGPEPGNGAGTLFPSCLAVPAAGSSTSSPSGGPRALH